LDTFPGPVEPTTTPQGVPTIHGAPSLRGHAKRESASVMLIEEPVVDLDDSASSNDFDH